MHEERMPPDEIFVSVAAYRDPQGPATVRDLYARARHPERIHVGALWQVLPEDADCLPPLDLPAGVRSGVIDARESRGACWARATIQRELYQGEPFFLQVDSHTRFVDGWDERLLAMWRSLQNPRAVLSYYPPPYTREEGLGPPVIPVLVAAAFTQAGMVSQASRCLSPEEAPSVPPPSAFIGAGFLFGPGDLVREVPYDPHLYFQGEEITLAVRLWTHGFDLHIPNASLVFHDYSPGRPRHWTDHADWTERNRRAQERVRGLLGAASLPPDQPEVDRYGLGPHRTLAEYQAFADIDFRLEVLGLRAREGRFPPHPPVDPASDLLRRRFTAIYAQNGWGAGETRSGPGSTRAATRRLRDDLTALLAHLGIRSLYDAGCGDLNWSEEVFAGLDLYLGVDVVEAVVLRNVRAFRHRPRFYFRVADLTRDPVPPVDAVFSRHCLPHLPIALVRAALENVRRSGARWLIATFHPGGANEEIEPGGWRPLDLRAPAFGLGEPELVLADGPLEAGVRLGVWRIRA